MITLPRPVLRGGNTGYPLYSKLDAVKFLKRLSLVPMQDNQPVDAEMVKTPTDASLPLNPVRMVEMHPSRLKYQFIRTTTSMRTTNAVLLNLLKRSAQELGIPKHRSNLHTTMGGTAGTSGKTTVSHRDSPHLR